MKLQYLAVIFILIIMPIVIVFSEYMNTQLTIVKTEEIYDARLLNSTYDAIKGFQMNTINSMYYTPTNRVKNVEASVNTFFNSLITSFKYDGHNRDVMKEYVPAVVLTMYDGYYIYSPFINTLTNVSMDMVDDDYKDKIQNGLKPYISYTCKYSKNNNIYMITYTMDNYITVDVFNNSGELVVSHDGYLINGITKGKDANGDSTYTYEGINFSRDTTEALSEFLKIDKSTQNFYYYVTIDGTKYYYDGSKYFARNFSEFNENDQIFYIDDSLNKHLVVKFSEGNQTKFIKYYNAIFKNNSAYEYYKNAFNFTNWLLTTDKIEDYDNEYGIGLNDLSTTNVESNYFNSYELVTVDNIFGGTIQNSDSNFNRHRADVIRAVITTNLTTAISGFRQYSSSNAEFIMPKISETDWELLENNICMATFLQGIKIAGKTYNSYAVVPNNFNKEYVDENDIYIMMNDHTYTKANDSSLSNNLIVNNVTSQIQPQNVHYEPALARINFEARKNVDDQYYNPVSVTVDTPYLESYTNLAGTSTLNGISTIDMYRYMSEKDGSGNYKRSESVRRAYYTALARERQSAYKFLDKDF